MGLDGGAQVEVVVVGADGEADRLLEAKGEEAGEEEGAEAEDMVRNQVFGYVPVRYAVGIRYEGVVGIGRVPSESDEDG